ncbi:MAG: aminotransferase class III-fold pyridoxal phosphate-dependent enzyme, partial [Planctomycetes bacterium]|nr:aminotransferase class III-fold pyridoxal phosphate-dependent enzyme [Planctomycetota bacterium]
MDAKTQKWLDEDARYFLHQSLSTPCLNVLSSCEGIYIEDLQGNRIMDFHGNYVHQVGFRNKRVIEAIIEQLNTLPFCTRRYTNIPAIRLARKLAELAPGKLNKVLFTPAGTAAIGMALKLARAATGRFKTISMWDSFHGASLDAISIGGEALFRKGMGPLLPGTEHVPPPDPLHCPFVSHKDCSRCDLTCA